MDGVFEVVEAVDSVAAGVVFVSNHPERECALVYVEKLKDSDMSGEQ
jgi:hypothetical protein